MGREIRSQDADRPALLGDRDHTRRIAGRAAAAVFVGMLLVLSSLAYALAPAGYGRIEQFGVTETILIGVVVLLAAAATAFAVTFVIHLLGREARARRRR